jgi:hypothetical protein
VLYIVLFLLGFRPCRRRICSDPLPVVILHPVTTVPPPITTSCSLSGEFPVSEIGITKVTLFHSIQTFMLLFVLLPLSCLHSVNQHPFDFDFCFHVHTHLVMGCCSCCSWSFELVNWLVDKPELGCCCGCSIWE